jgi:site-specific DNA recombinase
MTAILYIRISELTEATTSPERQLAECSAYAARMGWEVVNVFEDLDISGTGSLSQRPGMAQALRALESGAASHLIALKIDRVARSIVTFSEIVRRVDDAGGSLVLVAEQIDFSTAAGRMVGNVLASFAQFESETIGARVASAKKHLKEQGKWSGGRRPFGWVPEPHPSGKGFVLKLDPVEGPLLREITDRAIAGEGMTPIAADLNRRGIKTALGREWVGETVRKALTKGAMYGGSGEEQLMTEAQYGALQAKISRGKASRAHYDHSRHLLSREVARCGICGGVMIPATIEKGRRIYRCASRPAPGMKGHFLTASQPQVDEAVEEFLLSSIGRIPLEIAPEDEFFDPVADERAMIEESMRSLEEDRYVRGLFSGPKGSERFERIYTDLEARRNGLPELQRISPEVPAFPTGARFGEAWEGADIATRSVWLESMLDHVRIAPGVGGKRFDRERLRIQWKP